MCVSMIYVHASSDKEQSNKEFDWCVYLYTIEIIKICVIYLPNNAHCETNLYSSIECYR